MKARGVITETNLEFQQTSTLDSLGNWNAFVEDTNGGTAGGVTTQTRASNSANEIDTDNVHNDAVADDPINGTWADPVYDAAGNMIKAPKGQGSEPTGLFLIYDAFGHVAGISSTATTDGDFTDAGEVRYVYDALGRRIQKVFAGTATADEDSYYNEGYQELETRRNGSSNPYQQYVWDQRFIDTPIVRYRDVNGHGNSTSTGDGTLEETLYATYDANFNITGLVQENGTFVERYVYTPYGTRTILSSNFASVIGSSAYDWQLGHQGLRLDGETGSYYNRARYLNSSLGVFEQRDPLGTKYQDGMSLYQYLAGRPVSFNDPSGLCPNCQELSDAYDADIARLPQLRAQASAAGVPVTAAQSILDRLGASFQAATDDFSVKTLLAASLTTRVAAVSLPSDPRDPSYRYQMEQYQSLLDSMKDSANDVLAAEKTLNSIKGQLDNAKASFDAAAAEAYILKKALSNMLKLAADDLAAYQACVAAKQGNP